MELRVGIQTWKEFKLENCRESIELEVLVGPRPLAAIAQRMLLSFHLQPQTHAFVAVYKVKECDAQEVGKLGARTKMVHLFNCCLLLLLLVLTESKLLSGHLSLSVCQCKLALLCFALPSILISRLILSSN